MQEQRANVRVKDRLQVSYRLISDEDFIPEEGADKYFPNVWARYPHSIILLEESEDSNFKILPHIIDLNRKIDLLIEFLTQENKPKVEIPKDISVCISASGIKLDISEHSTPGQKIALCIILPFVPPTMIFIMGEITRSVPLSTSLNSGEEEMGICYETAVRFLDLKDDDYEKIVRYIFKKQRDILRDMKRLTTDGISD
jgi:hypothetical protein